MYAANNKDADQTARMRRLSVVTSLMQNSLATKIFLNIFAVNSNHNKRQ